MMGREKGGREGKKNALTVEGIHERMTEYKETAEGWPSGGMGMMQEDVLFLLLLL